MTQQTKTKPSPATTPKAKSTTPDQKPAAENAGQLAERLAQEGLELLRAGEHLLMKLGTDTVLSGPEYALFDRIGWDDDEVQRQLNRVVRVKRLLSQGCTERDIECAEACIGPLEAKLETAQTRLNDLKTEILQIGSEVAAAERHRDKLVQARDTLRDPGLLPQYIQKQYHGLRRGNKVRFGRAIAELETRLGMIDGVSVLTLSNTPGAADLHCSSLPEDHPCHPRPYRDGVHLSQAETDAFRKMPGRSMLELRVDQHSFAKYQAELAAERPKISARIDALRGESAVAMEPVERLRDHYFTELGAA